MAESSSSDDTPLTPLTFNSSTPISTPGSSADDEDDEPSQGPAERYVHSHTFNPIYSL